MRKQHTKTNWISLLLMGLGATLLLLAAGPELAQYPWRTAVSPHRAVEELPDPPPLVLSGEDSEVEILMPQPSPSGEETPPVEDYAHLPGEEKDAGPPSAYVLLGVIKIPRLELSQYLLEGTDRQLRYGVGHLPGTAAVGAKGNCAVAAHRNLSFRYLNLLRPGDRVSLTAGEDTYSYAVYESFEVEPDALWVLDNVPGEDYVLTMITCTPYLVSSHRLIVRARLEAVNGLSPAEFYSS